MALFPGILIPTNDDRRGITPQEQRLSVPRLRLRKEVFLAGQIDERIEVGPRDDDAGARRARQLLVQRRARIPVCLCGGGRARMGARNGSRRTSDRCRRRAEEEMRRKKVSGKASELR